MGGAVVAIEQGFYQNEIGRSAYDYQRAVESGEQVVVGVNRFEESESESPQLFRVDESVRQQQTERLEALRNRRDHQSVATVLNQLETAARADENLMPHILRAVECYTTLGEIAHRLRQVWGEYTG